jgi:hypothetical protein
VFGRAEVRTRGHGEWGRGIDHLRHAATHGVRKVSATVRPSFASTRVKVAPSAKRVQMAVAQGWGAVAAVALVPLMAVARDSATAADRRAAFAAGKAGKPAVKAKAGRAAGRAKARVIGKKRSRTSGTRTGLLVGLLAGGAVAGVAGALVARRRIRSQWEEPGAQGVGGVTGDVRFPDAVESPEDKSLGEVAGGLTTSTGSGKAAGEASNRTDSAEAHAAKQSKALGDASTGAEGTSITLEFGDGKDKVDQLAD